MRLTRFHITDFRSINDSAVVEVTPKLTVLVGRNESGKTALLKALQGIKAPIDANGDAGAKVGLPAFTLARDFPRDRARSEFSTALVVATTWWELSDSDRTELGVIWHRATTATHVRVLRTYASSRQIGFEGATALTAELDEVRAAASKVTKTVKTALKIGTDDAPKINEAVTAMNGALAVEKWVTDPAPTVAAIRTAFKANGLKTIPKNVDEAITDLESVLARVQSDDAQSAKARNWVVDRLPIFVYLDDWDSVPGQHNVQEYLDRRAKNTLHGEDRMFEKLLKVADLRADELQSLLATNHEERTLLTDRASRVFTKRLRELWKDRDIDVQFRVDAQHFDVLVKDNDTNALVPLDERSRGFRWYFSFYVTFTADTLGGDKSNAILLLDEPGLFLHATAQGQLIKLFRGLPNQIIYSTHSPFMIDPTDLGSVRTVSLDDLGAGTLVSEDLSGDARTLFPIQAALGYDIAQTLFVGTKNVIIEGVTDYWYLTAVAEYLREQGLTALGTDIALTPAGGAQKVSYLVSLLTAQRLHVVTLLDSEPGAAATKQDLVKNKLMRQDSVLVVADAFESPKPSEADIEDLLDPDVYQRLAEEAYATELAGRSLTPNQNVPRIVARLEQAFQALGIAFHKSRVAKRFLSQMSTAPASVLSPVSSGRFERLFAALNAAVSNLEGTDRPPFG